MKVQIVFLISLLSIALCQDAIAYLKGTSNDEGITGTVTFTQTIEGVEINVDLIDIVNNNGTVIGMHIHEYGDITSTDGSSAGSHYVGNGNTTHGCSDSSIRHAGDLGNFNVTDGKITDTRIDSIILLEGIHSIIGRGVVLHSQTDDCTGPAGNAGSRLAYGVIGLSSTTTVNSTDNDAIKSATCILTGIGSNNISGAVHLTQTGNLLSISANIKGINGEHGFHIHQYGDISDSTGSAVGSHYNPYSVSHGYPENATHHVGDLGNIADQDLNEIYTFEGTFNASLTGSYGVVGRAMIIHENRDNGEDPAGNAGNRIARCVIGVSMNPPEPDPESEPTTDEVPTAPEPSSYSKVEVVFSTFIISLLLSIFV